MSGLLAAASLAPAEQHYLLEARQMQALSLAVHIPPVCFGIAFPAMVLFCEWRFLRTGDPLFRTIARRWSKVMLALFAVGVVTGTILSFELGLLWPVFMARFGNVFGLGFTLEGFSFFVEAIFIAIYVYGWDGLTPRLHLLSGIPVAIAGVTGSLTVCSAKKSRSAFAGASSQVTCLTPFSQMSSLSPDGSSGQAQPGQSKPPFSWFITKRARNPSRGSPACSSTRATLRAAPQPAAGWS